jgi:hypothetical protein
MESTIEQNTMKACQQTKANISQNMKDYLDFAVKTLDDGEFVKSATALLPFDNFADARLRFMDDSSRLKSMGLSLMKNELEPARYSLGVSIELAGDDGKENTETTAFIIAGRTLDELKGFVESDQFAKDARQQLEQQVEEYFYPVEES